MEQAEMRELVTMVEQVLQRLGPEHGCLILEHALEGKKDVGSTLLDAPSVGAIWVRRHRARKKLMALLKRAQHDAWMPKRAA
jgi:hypothetical protein